LNTDRRVVENQVQVRGIYPGVTVDICKKITLASDGGIIENSIQVRGIDIFILVYIPGKDSIAAIKH
jgi:hypothetical protein